MVEAWANRVVELETVKKSKWLESSKARSLKPESLQGQSSRPEEEMGSVMGAGSGKQCANAQGKFLSE